MTARQRTPEELAPALILAAGKGTRLEDLGRRCAKVLLPVGGRPVLDRQLEYLAAEGVRRVVINAHHLAEQIVEYVDRYRGPLRVEVSYEPELLGTAGAAVNTLAQLGPSQLLVLYGDVLIFEPLGPLLQAHRNAGATATLTVYHHHDLTAKGVIETDDDGRVTSFAEKGARGGSGLVNAGLYVIESRLLDGFPRGQFLDFGDDVFPAALRAGLRLQAYLLPERVLDIGTPDDFARANVEERQA